MKKEMAITINGEIFESYREMFDRMLHKTISEMEEKASQDGKVTTEIAINIIDIDETDTATGELVNRKIPSFEFKIGSAMEDLKEFAREDKRNKTRQKTEGNG